jgi:hypothetical protein
MMRPNTILKRLKPYRRHLRVHYGLKKLTLLRLWRHGRIATHRPLRLVAEFGVVPSAFAVVRLEATLAELLKREVSLILRQPQDNSVPEPDTAVRA